MTLRPEERWTLKWFVNTSKIPEGKWRPQSKKRCGAVSGTVSVNQRSGSEGGRIGTDGLESVTERRFFPAKEEQMQAFDRRSALREGLWSIWRVDMDQALRMCEDRQDEVDASDVSQG